MKRLRRNVLTVITRENFDEIVQLGVHLREQTGIDGQYFEVVRGAAPDPSLKAITRESVAALHRQLMPFHRHYAKKLFARLPQGARQLARMYYLGNLRFHSICTSSAWNRRKRGRCRAPRGKPQS